MFGWLRRKSKKRESWDPLAAYDEMIEDLEKEAARIRQSAATLAMCRSELSRRIETAKPKLEDLDRRFEEADRAGEALLAKTFDSDRERARRVLTSDEASLKKTEDDAELLATAAHRLADRIAELKSERVSARANLAMGGAVSEAMRADAGNFRRALELDEARDEVERAHALAEMYREEQSG